MIVSKNFDTFPRKGEVTIDLEYGCQPPIQKTRYEIKDLEEGETPSKTFHAHLETPRFQGGFEKGKKDHEGS